MASPTLSPLTPWFIAIGLKRAAPAGRGAGLDAAVFFLIGLSALLLALAATPVILAWSEPSETSIEHEAGA